MPWHYILFEEIYMLNSIFKGLGTLVGKTVDITVDVVDKTVEIVKDTAEVLADAPEKFMEGYEHSRPESQKPVKAEPSSKKQGESTASSSETNELKFSKPDEDSKVS